MAAWPAHDFGRNVEALVQALIDAAACGLVHGRHSSENILVTEPLDFHIIDFSHAQIFEHFQPQGFMLDVARIGARLELEGACSRDALKQLFDCVEQRAPFASVSAKQMYDEFEHTLKSSKRLLRFERKRRTFWRGLPWRLHHGT